MEEVHDDRWTKPYDLMATHAPRTPCTRRIMGRTLQRSAHSPLTTHDSRLSTLKRAGMWKGLLQAKADLNRDSFEDMFDGEVV